VLPLYGMSIINYSLLFYNPVLLLYGMSIINYLLLFCNLVLLYGDVNH